MKHPNIIPGFCLVSLLTLFSACSSLQKGSVIVAHNKFADGKYESALDYLSRGEGYAKATPDVAAEIGFFKGLCYDGLNQPDQAWRSFKSAADCYPETDFGYKSKLMLNCEPLDLGPPAQEPALLRGLDQIYNVPTRPSSHFVEAAAISGDGKVFIGKLVLISPSLFSAPATTVNLFRWTPPAGAQLIGAIQAPATMTDNDREWIVKQRIKISADGAVVAGCLGVTNGTGAHLHAFRWSEAQGTQDLGQQSKYPWTDTKALSSDGSVLVGGYMQEPGTNEPSGFFRWTQSGGFEDLGNFDAPARFGALSICGVSDDGATVTGSARLREGEQVHVFRWTQTGGFQDLGTFGGLSANALTASSDGSSFVAAARMAGNSERVLRWTQGAGSHELGRLEAPGVAAAGASEDGSVVVGSAHLVKSDPLNPIPFRWTPSAGLQSVCEFGADWEAQIVGASRDGSRVLLNTYYGMTYQQGRLVIPVHHVTISLSHFTTASVFYKTFIWNSNERLRRFKSMSLVFADGVNTPFSSKALPLFEQQIKDRLQSSGYSLADSNAEMVLEVTVNEFSPGSRALRTTVGFGAGQAVLKYTARLKDSQGKLLDEMEGGKVYKGTEFNSADNPIFKSDEYIRAGLISSSVSQLSEFIHHNRNRLN